MKLSLPFILYTYIQSRSRYNREIYYSREISTSPAPRPPKITRQLIIYVLYLNVNTGGGVSTGSQLARENDRCELPPPENIPIKTAFGCPHSDYSARPLLHR